MRPPVTKDLPLTIKISGLKNVLQRLFRLAPARMALSLQSSPDDPFRTPIEDDTQTLGYYGPTDGCAVVMDDIEVVGLPHAPTPGRPAALTTTLTTEALHRATLEARQREHEAAVRAAQRAS
eukprot:gnl/Trimastix_PCT/3508.p3 GENE.gnl/Trimastix_PCT/3508~~gnl/Trimastix_PCT/3508.p3  ORF type:complete len:122 (-),score=41.84 gnl/Trimastix_PCT/3508:37-402(-)